jgi:hypothetical protein
VKKEDVLKLTGKNQDEELNVYLRRHFYPFKND